jgi:hypothetical protein
LPPIFLVLLIWFSTFHCILVLQSALGTLTILSDTRQCRRIPAIVHYIGSFSCPSKGTDLFIRTILRCCSCLCWALFLHFQISNFTFIQTTNQRIHLHITYFFQFRIFTLLIFQVVNWTVFVSSSYVFV